MDSITEEKKNISRAVLKLSLPAVAEQTMFMVVGVVSTILVGRISKEAISAVGLVNNLAGFIMVIFVALSTGSTVLVARLTGQGDRETAKEAMRLSVMLGAVLAVIVSALMYIFATPVLVLLFGRAEQEVLGMAASYFRITMLTFPLALVNIMISGSMRGAGDTKMPMYIANIVNIINVILGYTLIFGINFDSFTLGGIGFRGAAMAVSLSRGIGGILSISALYLPGSPLKTKLLRKLNLDMQLIKRILKVGLPAAIEQIVMQGGFLIIQVMIAGMGTVAIAVYQICMSINSICYIPVWGFGIGATTLVGQNLGAGRPDIAEKYGWSATKISVMLITVITIIVFAIPDKLISIYSSDPELIKNGMSAIRIFSLSQPFLAVVVVLSGSLRGAGDIRYVMLTTFIGIWGFRLLVTALLDSFLGMGINGVWIAYCADFFIRSMLYLARFRRGKWKQIIV